MPCRRRRSFVSLAALVALALMGVLVALPASADPDHSAGDYFVFAKAAGDGSTSDRTPGYWKNHRAATESLLPVSLGNYQVDTFARVQSVFKAMNCGSSKPQAVIGCLAGNLLAAKLNVKSGADPCINATITKADDFLKGLTVNGVPGIVYTGPTDSYTTTAAQRALAIQLKNALDTYNNGGGC